MIISSCISTALWMRNLRGNASTGAYTRAAPPTVAVAKNCVSMMRPAPSGKASPSDAVVSTVL